ncbi:MAG: glycoside hydrolase family 9 protein [Cyanobacteria bacterium J06614_10]
MAKLQVTHPHAVSSDVIALRIETGDITRGRQEKYVRQPGDEIVVKPSNKKYKRDNRVVKRDGKFVGMLLENDTIIRTPDTLTGPELDEAWAKQASNYSINGVTPTAVYMKSKPGASARVGIVGSSEPLSRYDFAMEHTVYLKLPKAMTAGESYKLDFKGDELEDLLFEYAPEKVRSEAVHVSHVGFQPEDPAKVAFLSTWMGPKGKGLSYEEGQKFWLVNRAGKKVYEGEIELSKAQHQAEDFLGKNYNGTDVYMADFSDFTQKGEYKVVVEDVGTSFSFKIDDKAWEDAFQIHMEGLFNQRSGLEKTGEFSDYVAERGFHMEDGVKVYQSEGQAINTRSGLDKSKNMFEELNEKLTNKVVGKDAWGGWADAGDWDRSIMHLDVSRKLLEIGDLFPDYFKGVNLTIPESKNKVADVLDEALWGVDFFKRIQTAEGGVGGGIESASHPEDLEGSWQETLKVIAYAPDIWTTYQYAGVAARAAYVMEGIDPARAKDYLASAQKAMEWAESEHNKSPNKYKHLPQAWKLPGERNLAAAELYRAGGEAKWHDLFLETTVFTNPKTEAYTNNKKTGVQHDQRNASFVYTLTERPVDKAVQDLARAAVIKTGERNLEAIHNAGFKWSKDPGARIGWGAHDGFTDRTGVLRAHYLTGEQKYLEGGILASQFIGGANPDNVSYTTGIGPRQPDSAHHIDSYVRGMKAPNGISLYGVADLSLLDKRSQFALDAYRTKTSTKPEDWPTAESFFDIYKYIPGSEFTIAETIAPNAYATGYFAANNAQGGKRPSPPTAPDPIEPAPPTPPATPDPIEPDPPTPPEPSDPAIPTPGVLRVEAESLDLRDYQLHNASASDASGGQYVSLAEGKSIGTVKGRFEGPAGEYRVSVGYFDEADGRSVTTVRVAGKRTEFTFDKELGGDSPSAATQAEKVTHDSVMIKPGDSFVVRSRRHKGETGALDYVVFEPLNKTPGSPSTPKPPLKPLPAPTLPANDLVIDLSALDFDGNGQPDDKVALSLEGKARGDYRNTVGFYAVENAEGAIVDEKTGKTLLPGDEGYRRVAIAQRLEGLDLDPKTGEATLKIDGDQLLAPFITANNTPEELLKANKGVDMKTAYFGYEAANSDGAKHVIVQGAGEGADVLKLGFEDLRGGGDQSFTDFVVSAKVSAV